MPVNAQGEGDAITQKIVYLTERAAFRFLKNGLEEDILAHMEFRPLLVRDLEVLDRRWASGTNGSRKVFRKTGKHIRREAYL